MFLMTFFSGLIVSIGISNLQFINLNSSRNMMVLGISIMTGMALPEWIENNKDTIKTGTVSGVIAIHHKLSPNKIYQLTLKIRHLYTLAGFLLLERTLN